MRFLHISEPEPFNQSYLLGQNIFFVNILAHPIKEFDRRTVRGLPDPVKIFSWNEKKGFVLNTYRRGLVPSWSRSQSFTP